MDVERQNADILANLPTDPIAKAHLSDTSNPRWSTDETGYLHLDGRMYVLDAQTITGPRPTMEFHLDGFHRATPILIQLHSHTGSH